MPNEAKGQTGAVLATLKVVLVLIAVVGVGAMALMVIGLVVGPPRTPSPDRILAECAARFSDKGAPAVEACVSDLAARVADEERKRLLDDAYRASRRPE